ncbi:MAG: T9SS type A sorting domain-containing protein [Bacteroidetes bacterium]|nr:T9SS type A sorting domain-containing protein [Bacteroidota bacterium]
MKKTFFLLTYLFAHQYATAQVPKKVVVEHFTNTKCSVCALRNPGFYSNLYNQTDVIHLAIHPSSPYSACLFSLHNALENDGRTNYYGVYGGTPRLVIQGEVISGSADYSLASMFTPYLSQTSPASIKITQSKYGTDSIRSTIVIKTEAVHSLGALSLFVALAEDTINYTGSNGESVHYDVFRKSLTGTSGVPILLPSTVGDSVVYTMVSTTNAAWNVSRIFTLAILQETISKSVVQSEAISASSNTISTGISSNEADVSNTIVYSNASNIFIQTELVFKNEILLIYDLTGRLLFQQALQTATEQTISLAGLSNGIYVYSIQSNNQSIKKGKVLLINQ